ncbi:MAG: hypothetical protein P9L92_17225 [Candidatus Electryonea clarkiae]|nr:hypothetical protein [Candidatus Electryonea clarkiae]MDP8288229.1 hypothetical protein [Candidatus Electryonea clarkiae]
MTFKRFFILLPLIFGLLIIGCSEEDSPIGPPESYDVTDDDYEDSAEDFGALLADPEEGILQYWMDPLGDGGHHMMQMPGKQADREIADTTFPRGNLTFTIDLTFYDAEDNASEIYDSASTVRLTRLMTIEGAREDTMRHVSINHSDFIEVNGIAPDDTIRILNGNGNRTISGNFQSNARNVERSWQAEHTWTNNNIQIHKNRDDFPYPLDGDVNVVTSFEREVSAGEYTRTFDVEIEYTVFFDGTQLAHVVVEGGGEFWIDLDDGRGYRIRPLLTMRRRR